MASPKLSQPSTCEESNPGFSQSSLSGVQPCFANSFEMVSITCGAGYRTLSVYESCLDPDWTANFTFVAPGTVIRAAGCSTFCDSEQDKSVINESVMNLFLTLVSEPANS